MRIALALILCVAPAHAQDGPTGTPASSPPAPAHAGHPPQAASKTAKVETVPLEEAIRFKFGSADIKPVSDAELKRLAAVIRDRADQRIVEIGVHTGPQGSSRYNKALSQTRAEAVRARLIALGVAPARLTAVGYGEEGPILHCPRKNRGCSRRVELRVLP